MSQLADCVEWRTTEFAGYVAVHDGFPCHRG
jgi:hypothetical protein